VIKFFVILISVLISLFFLELLNGVQHAVIAPFTGLLAKISAEILQFFDSSVRANGVIIQNIHSGLGVQIEPGCNGVEACIVLIAAVVAFPSSWRNKIIGIVFGVIAIQAVNILRIISLFYLAQLDQSLFEFAHLYLWQALIMLDVLIVFLFWVGFVNKQRTVQASGECPEKLTSSPKNN
jgi:exosortase H (IPTLxxWG-CTERM-specific)